MGANLTNPFGELEETCLDALIPGLSDEVELGSKQECQGDGSGTRPLDGSKGETSLLEENDTGLLSQQPQDPSSENRESYSSLDDPHGSLVALEYLPFFRTHGPLLTEELVPKPEIYRNLGGEAGDKEALLSEDSELPGGFLPYYRSKEENFSSLDFPGRSCGNFHSLPTEKEVLACSFCRMVASCSCSTQAAPGLDFIPGTSHTLTCCPILREKHSHNNHPDATLYSDAVFKDHIIYASGFVPYYRTPEEILRTSPGPPASPSEGQKSTGHLHNPHTERGQELVTTVTSRDQVFSTC